MNKILIFAGTTEGRILWEYCTASEIPATAAVATEYGDSILPESEFSETLVGRMDRRQMEEVLHSGQYKLVIDATHPYAVEVTENIRAACKECKVRYIRILRESLRTPGVKYVESMEEAAEFLSTHEGTALITTGSKALKVFTKIPDYASRLTVRVLPDYENVKLCMELGFTGRHLICMQGPFSERLNLAILKEINAAYLVTKEAGTYGGFMEKVHAAKKAGARVIVIRRPKEEEGYTIQEVLAELEGMKPREQFGKKENEDSGKLL